MVDYEFIRNWPDKCISHCRSAGYTTERGEIRSPVINKDEHPKEWALWIEYYTWRGMDSSARLMREKNEKTVPEKSPINFDAEFVPSVGV